jgi:restriction system protein
MAISFSLRNLYDSATEIVGIKSGLLLNYTQVSKFLLKSHDLSFQPDNLEKIIRIHSSDFEELVIHLRQSIGNLPNEIRSKKANNYIFNFFQRKQNDIATIGLIQKQIFEYIKNFPDASPEYIGIFVSFSNNFDQEFCISVATQLKETIDLNCIIPSVKEWNDRTELSKLFECELNSKNTYLEQKFIDYLAVNGDEIETIHWRNFERLCAEYFKKEGYEVVLGSGTNDGGVDIRAYSENNKIPDFLIQCKRYKKENKVSIETVKSFYSDVLFEGAKKRFNRNNKLYRRWWKKSKQGEEL